MTFFLLYTFKIASPRKTKRREWFKLTLSRVKIGSSNLEKEKPRWHSEFSEIEHSSLCRAQIRRETPSGVVCTKISLHGVVGNFRARGKWKRAFKRSRDVKNRDRESSDNVQQVSHLRLGEKTVKLPCRFVHAPSRHNHANNKTRDFLPTISRKYNFHVLRR